MNNSDIPEFIITILIITSITYSAIYLYSTIISSDTDPSTNTNTDPSTNTDSSSTSIKYVYDKNATINKLEKEINSWLIANSDENNVLLNRPDSIVLLKLNKMLSLKHIPIPLKYNSKIFNNFYDSKIPFDFDLYYLIVYNLRSTGGMFCFDDALANQGFKYYLSWVTQVYRDLHKSPFSLGTSSKFYTHDFSRLHYFKHDINLLFKGYSDIVKDELEDFTIKYDAIQQALDSSKPIIDLKESCVLDKSHVCSSCSIPASFKSNEHWIFDILNNKYDHLYTIIKNNNGNYSFKYHSYSDMYNKRLDFIEHVRNQENDSDRADMLEKEYLLSLNSVFDLHLGRCIKNLHMLRESNYFKFYYDRNYWSKMYWYNSKTISDDQLMSIKYFRFDEDSSIFRISVNEPIDWIVLSEAYRVNVSISHLCNSWDSFIESKNDILINKIKMSFLKDNNDPERLKIWEMITQEDDKQTRIKLWSSFLKNEANLVDYIIVRDDQNNFYFKTNYDNFECILFDRNSGKIIGPLGPASDPRVSQSESTNSKESSDWNNVPVNFNSGTNGGNGSEGTGPDNISNLMSPSDLSIVSYSALEYIIHLSASIIVIFYSLFIWSIFFMTMYFFLKLYYDIYIIHYKYMFIIYSREKINKYKINKYF